MQPINNPVQQALELLTEHSGHSGMAEEILAHIQRNDQVGTVLKEFIKLSQQQYPSSTTLYRARKGHTPFVGRWCQSWSENIGGCYSCMDGWNEEDFEQAQLVKVIVPNNKILFSHKVLPIGYEEDEVLIDSRGLNPTIHSLYNSEKPVPHLDNKLGDWENNQE